MAQPNAHVKVGASADAACPLIRYATATASASYSPRAPYQSQSDSFWRGGQVPACRIPIPHRIQLKAEPECKLLLSEAQPLAQLAHVDSERASRSTGQNLRA